MFHNGPFHPRPWSVSSLNMVCFILYMVHFVYSRRALDKREYLVIIQDCIKTYGGGGGSGGGGLGQGRGTGQGEGWAGYRFYFINIQVAATSLKHVSSNLWEHL